MGLASPLSSAAYEQELGLKPNVPGYNTDSHFFPFFFYFQTHCKLEKNCTVYAHILTS